jgi:heme-degrading monooxygenase HmoA
MVVVIFRSRIREGIAEDPKRLEETGQRMYELASRMPGFISYKDFAAADGENLSVVEFESPETLAAWRNHPEHKLVQEWGKREVFAEYHIQVCTPVRDYRFRSTDAQGERERSAS